MLATATLHQGSKLCTRKLAIIKTKVKLYSYIKFASLSCSLEGLVGATRIVHLDLKASRHLFLVPSTSF